MRSAVTTSQHHRGFPCFPTRLLLAGLAVALIAISGAGCGDGEQAQPPSKFAVAHAGLCSAADQIRDGSALDARATFFNRSHGELHRLAAELAEKDRAVAARLLTQKQAVEVGPWVDGDAGQARRLSALATTTRAGIGVLGDAEPARCPLS